MSTVKTLGEMNKMVGELARIRELADLKKAEVSALHKQKVDLEQEILSQLEQNDLTKFDGEAGRVTRVAKFEVKFPKDDERSRDSLRKYLEEKGTFENMWSINHMSLNSWYKEEFEAAKERDVEDFDIPGLEPSDRITIQFRRSKK